MGNQRAVLPAMPCLMLLIHTLSTDVTFLGLAWCANGFSWTLSNTSNALMMLIHNWPMWPSWVKPHNTSWSSSVYFLIQYCVYFFRFVLSWCCASAFWYFVMTGTAFVNGQVLYYGTEFDGPVLYIMEATAPVTAGNRPACIMELYWTSIVLVNGPFLYHGTDPVL